MKKLVLYFIVVIITMTGLILLAGSVKREPDFPVIHKTSEKGFVVMELFTSQGCSSCPPADEILGKYAMAEDEHIIPIAFHVDYWNRLGWTDSFSNPKFTQRQHEYASKFGLESVYTPQLIINGQKEILGSDQRSITGIVDGFLKEPSATDIKVADKLIHAGQVEISYSLNRISPGCFMNGVLLKNKTFTQIRAGENRGMKQVNYNVVKNFARLPLSGTVGKISLQLPPAFITGENSIVLFVQNEVSGKIIGAVKLKL